MTTTSPADRRSPTPATRLAALSGAGSGQVAHVETLPARSAQAAAWPDWVNPQVAAAVAGTGVESLWSHQRRVADLAHEGRHVVVSTGTASGKSLGYLLPVLSAVADGASAPTGRGATALYLSPTKALAGDQLAAIERLAIPGVRAATYDGDTAVDERRWIRDHAQLILTNPDLLHHTLLPQHERWAPFLRALRYVVIDECHSYRGLFGSHLASVLRRLRRICARYRAEPTFVLASATVADPALHAERLTGLPVQAVDQDGSPRAEMTFALWQPGPTGPEHDAPQRSAVAETGDLLARLVGDGTQTLAFARSRVGVEVVADMVRHRLAEEAPHLVDHVAAYRGGFLPEERRQLEQGLRSGQIRGLAATNALELGIDVSGLDAVILAGWPGTVGSLWQQAGRAGRRGSPALVVFVADDDPLDSYLVQHPDALFGRPIEAAVVDPANPYVLAPHLAAAAAELPLTEADSVYFGSTMLPLLDTLVERGALRRRPRGWFWARPDRPSDHLSLRGSGQPVVRIVENRTGRVLGTVDAERSHTATHTGAVYVHQGRPHVVTELDLEDGSAHVTPGDPGWSTVARTTSDFRLVSTEHSTPWRDGVLLSTGVIDVETQVTSFIRRLPSGEVLGQHPLELPSRRLRTRGVWWTLPSELLGTVVEEADAPGALHAAEHCSIGMLPIVAPSDRWDVGGVSTTLHPDTGLPTVVVYDGWPGGAGFAAGGYARAASWLRATLAAIDGCPCRAGCPSCVQSPKCGNGNAPLDKAGAARVLRLILAGASDPGWGGTSHP